jgi:DNA-binding CsgD family transcriptional regulator
VHFESLSLSQSIGDKEQVANCLTELASVAAGGKPGDAITIYAATEALRSAIGAPISPADRVRYETALANVQHRLSKPAFQAAWHAGLSISTDEAIALAHQLFEPSTIARPSKITPPPEKVATFGITTRELEVLRLLAAGKSNNEIANELSISVLTAKTHVSRILFKLDLPSRAAAVAFYHWHGFDASHF